MMAMYYIFSCSCRVYTLCSKKGCHQTHGGNFVKSQLIFKILSPLEREGNFQQNACIISHHTLSMLPHYLWNLKVQICANLEENANKNVTMNQLSFHSYRKIEPWANFEFTSFKASLINDRRSNS